MSYVFLRNIYFIKNLKFKTYSNCSIIIFDFCYICSYTWVFYILLISVLIYVFPVVLFCFTIRGLFYCSFNNVQNTLVNKIIVFATSLLTWTSLCIYPVLCPCSCYVISLCLRLLICKMRLLIISASKGSLKI